MNILHSPCFLYTVYNVIVEFSSKTIVTNSRRGHALDTFPPPQPVHKLLFKKRRKKKNFSKLKTDNSPSGNISTRVFPPPRHPLPEGRIYQSSVQTRSVSRGRKTSSVRFLSPVRAVSARPIAVAVAAAVVVVVAAVYDRREGTEKERCPFPPSARNRV